MLRPPRPQHSTVADVLLHTLNFKNILLVVLNCSLAGHVT